MKLSELFYDPRSPFLSGLFTGCLLVLWGVGLNWDKEWAGDVAQIDITIGIFITCLRIMNEK